MPSKLTKALNLIRSERGLIMIGVMAMMGFGILANFGLTLSLSKNSTKEDFGTYQYWLGYAQLAAMLLAVGLPQASLRFIPQYLAKGDDDLVYKFLVYAEKRLAVFVGIGLAVAILTGVILSDVIVGLILCQFGVLLWLNWRSDVLQAEGYRVKARFFGQLLFPLTSLVTFWIIFSYTNMANTPVMALSAFVAAFVVVAVSHVSRNHYDDHRLLRATTKQEREWTQSSLTILYASISTLLMAKADRIMVGWFCGEAAVAEYAVAMQLCLIMPLGGTIINRYLGQNYSKHFTNGDMHLIRRDFRMTRLFSFLFALPIQILFVFFGTILLGFFGDGYQSSYWMLIFLALGQLVNVGFSGVAYVMIGVGQEAQYSKVMIAACIMNIVLNAIFIPIFGNIGAAVTSLVTYITWNVGLYVLAKKHIKSHE